MTQTSKPSPAVACQLRRTVVLVGMMGSGKTAIGKALAVRLNVPFLDSDAAIEEAAATSIAEIFQRDGEAFFRKRGLRVPVSGSASIDETTDEVLSTLCAAPDIMEPLT